MSRLLFLQSKKEKILVGLNQNPNKQDVRFLSKQINEQTHQSGMKLRQKNLSVAAVYLAILTLEAFCGGIVLDRTEELAIVMTLSPQ
jgi:hypothetical protein